MTIDLAHIEQETDPSFLLEIVRLCAVRLNELAQSQLTQEVCVIAAAPNELLRGLVFEEANGEYHYLPTNRKH
jgi:hypothetical protein